MIASALLASSIALAQAADPYTPDSLKDTFTEDRSDTVYFQGLGIGVDVGAQFTSVALTGEVEEEVSGEFDGISADGLVGGIHLDYLVAIDPEQRTRFGIYGEGGFSNVNTTATNIIAPGEVDVLKQDYYYGTGLKAGVIAFEKTLLFARFGYEWSQWSTDLAPDADINVGSWAIGGGIDTMVSEEWSLALEGTYLFVNGVDLEDEDVTSFVEESEAGRIKARLSRRF